jgi:hypothetical protein
MNLDYIVFCAKGKINLVFLGVESS